MVTLVSDVGRWLFVESPRFDPGNRVVLVLGGVVVVGGVFWKPPGPEWPSPSQLGGGNRSSRREGGVPDRWWGLSCRVDKK